jgi:hypothetical protein
MAANQFRGDAPSPFERRRLDELRRRLENDDPLLAAALTHERGWRDHGRPHRARSALLAVAGTLATAVVALGAVVMFGFASVVGVLCSAFTMYGIFKLCATADRTREQRPQ